MGIRVTNDTVKSRLCIYIDTSWTVLKLHHASRQFVFQLVLTPTTPRKMGSIKEVSAEIEHSSEMTAFHDEHKEADPVTVVSAAQAAENLDHVKPSPWTPSMFRLYTVLMCAYLGACTNGFDGSVMGYVDFWIDSLSTRTYLICSGLNAMTSYLEYFHMYVS